jgi:hypothetical protein
MTGYSVPGAALLIFQPMPSPFSYLSHPGLFQFAVNIDGEQFLGHQFLHKRFYTFFITGLYASTQEKEFINMASFNTFQSNFFPVPPYPAPSYQT